MGKWTPIQEDLDDIINAFVPPDGNSSENLETGHEEPDGCGGVDGPHGFSDDSVYGADLQDYAPYSNPPHTFLETTEVDVTKQRYLWREKGSREFTNDVTRRTAGD